MDTTGAPITLDGLAREAGVSRSWLYTQHDLRAEVKRRRRRHRPPTPPAVPPERQRATEASLLQRLQAATNRIHHQARWRAVNAPHLVALVRAGATFKNGKLVERPDEHPQPEAA